MNLDDDFRCPECECTFLETGNSISVQHFFRCETCFPGSKIRLICAACASACHKGHMIVNAGICSGFCDCGSGSLPEGIVCNRLFSFGRKINLVRLSKSRRDNFTFILKHVCWFHNEEIVEVYIKQLNPITNSFVFEEEEEELEELIEEEDEKEKHIETAVTQTNLIPINQKNKSVTFPKQFSSGANIRIHRRSQADVSRQTNLPNRNKNMNSNVRIRHSMNNNRQNINSRHSIIQASSSQTLNIRRNNSTVRVNRQSNVSSRRNPNVGLNPRSNRPINLSSTSPNLHALTNTESTYNGRKWTLPKEETFVDYDFELILVDNPKAIANRFLDFVSTHNYQEAYSFLQKISQPSQQLLNIFKTEPYLQKMREFIKTAPKESWEMMDLILRFDFQDMLSPIDKIDLLNRQLLFNFHIYVSRSKILTDSIKSIKGNSMKNALLIVSFMNEKGVDDGGMLRDWFTSISHALIKSQYFISVPDGCSLTFNSVKLDENICYFTGQLIALCITNKTTINLKLTSFIWKKLMNENIDLEDLLDYDKQLYQSLKWISKNDPSPMMLTFTNSHDKPLCKNGRSIQVTQKNKKQYMRLIMNDILINKNKKGITKLVEGFHDSIDYPQYKCMLKSDDIKRLIIGVEEININDWKNNTIYPLANFDQFHMFFDIISKWNQENQRKLLKFVTGSSQIPINGFEYYENIGGKFQICFNNEVSEKLPVSHTCVNTIVLPTYSSQKQFEEKLLLAIECDDFGFI